MRRFFLLLLISMIVAGLFAALTQYDPGYIRISWNHWLIETNFWFGTISLLILIALGYFGFRLIQSLISSKTGIRGWFKGQSKRRAQSLTTQGLLAFAEGNWQDALKLLKTGAVNSETPLINYLAAAQAAYEQGKEEESEKLLKKAWESTPGANIAVGITQAQLYLDNHKNEQCLAALLRLKKEAPHHPFLLKLLKVVYVRLGDWQQLSVLLPDLERYRVIQGQELDQLSLTTWKELIKQTSLECARQKGSSQNIDRLTQQWQRVPNKLQKNNQLIATYAQALIELGAGDLAEPLLRKALNKQWDEEMIRLYGLIPNLERDSAEKSRPSYGQALLFAENWLKERPSNATLFLTLGRLALQNHLWGKAKEYFEASHQLHKTKETYGELCRLAYHMQDNETGDRLFMQGLLSQVGLPDLPLPSAPTTSN